MLVFPPATQRTRRKVFVSYHHGGDQAYYDAFSKVFHETYESVTDNSLERKIDSSDSGYIMRRIREENLKGSSCLIVLCGAQTFKRKFVDWEIHASLSQGMGLVGVGLPGILTFPNGGTAKPERLQDNINTGYVEWAMWSAVYGNEAALSDLIERANRKSLLTIDNTRPRLFRNAS